VGFPVVLRILLHHRLNCFYVLSGQSPLLIIVTIMYNIPHMFHLYYFRWPGLLVNLWWPTLRPWSRRVPHRFHLDDFRWPRCLVGVRRPRRTANHLDLGQRSWWISKLLRLHARPRLCGMLDLSPSQITNRFLACMLSPCSLGFGMVAWGEPNFTFVEDVREERRREMIGRRGRGMSSCEGREINRRFETPAALERAGHLWSVWCDDESYLPNVKTMPMHHTMVNTMYIGGQLPPLTILALI
jgi:hypothetical protein